MINDSTTSIESVRRKAGYRTRRMGAVAMAVCLVTGLSVLASGDIASAASQGAANYATCDPNTATIKQTVEAYPAFGEFVTLRSFVRNETTGQSFSHWMYPDPYASSAAAQNTVTWSAMPRGAYSVWYQWAVWNAATRTYAYSPFVQVSRLTTQGRALNAGIYLNSTNGWCGI